MAGALSIRGSSNYSTTYECIYIFCDRKKIRKGTRNREPLALQYRDMRAYSSIKKMATLTNDRKILALVSSELIHLSPKWPPFRYSLFLFKSDLDASFKAKYSFEFSAQERGIKG